jgi:hypothetical protein
MSNKTAAAFHENVLALFLLLRPPEHTQEKCIINKTDEDLIGAEESAFNSISSCSNLPFFYSIVFL